MLTNLKGKLDTLRQERQIQHLDVPKNLVQSRCRMEKSEYSLKDTIGFFTLEEGFLSAEMVSLLTLTPLEKGFTMEQVLFLDTETTGLSSGPGTIAFLVGLGFFRDGVYIVEQYLLEDYDQEPDLLQRLKQRLNEFSVLATFNGKSYDAPLLETRFILNRLHPEFRDYKHLDLLHALRRLYKRSLSPCSLGHAEEALLGIIRQDDIPGAQIPQCFFAYLQNHDPEPIQRIISHNRQDIVSMPLLLAKMAQTVLNPSSISAIDAYSVGALYERYGDISKARQAYLASNSSMAKLALAAGYKKEQKCTQALSLWEQLLNEEYGFIQATQEIAKYEEHYTHNYSAALVVVQKTQARLKSIGMKDEDLEKRRIRLEKYQKEGV